MAAEIFEKLTSLMSSVSVKAEEEEEEEDEEVRFQVSQKKIASYGYAGLSPWEAYFFDTLYIKIQWEDKMKEYGIVGWLILPYVT